MIPNWLADFLWGAIPAFFKRFFGERAVIGSHQDKGAADQRAADDEADDEITAEAKGSADEIAKAPDDDIEHRLSRWRRIGRM